MSTPNKVNLPKRMKAWADKVQPGKQYDVETAMALVKEFAKAKFDESVDVAVKLGIDASKSDQQVRGSTVLPNGTGKTVRVAVFTGGKNQDRNASLNVPKKYATKFGHHFFPGLPIP